MDEPTSVLTPQEVEQLFVVLRQLAERRLLDPLHLATSCTRSRRCAIPRRSCRGGKVVDTCDPKVETSRSMAEKMIGAGLKDIQQDSRAASSAREKFVVQHLDRAGRSGHFGMALKDISFTVHAGEIFGIAGVAGNGQNALLLALSGEEPAHDADMIALDGEPIGRLTAKAAAAEGHGERARGAQRPRRGARFHASPTIRC